MNPEDTILIACFDYLASISGIFPAQGACTSIPGIHFIHTSQRTCHNKQFREGGNHLWVISWWLYSTSNYVCSQCIYEVFWTLLDDSLSMLIDCRHLFLYWFYTYLKYSNYTEAGERLGNKQLSKVTLLFFRALYWSWGVFMVLLSWAEMNFYGDN